MNTTRFWFLRVLCVIAMVSLLAISQARIIAGAGGCQVGSYIYTAQQAGNTHIGNGYQGALRVSKVSTSGVVQWVKDITLPTGMWFQYDYFSDESIVRVDTSGNVWAVTTLYGNLSSTVYGGEIQINQLNSSGSLLHQFYYAGPTPIAHSPASGGYFYDAAMDTPLACAYVDQSSGVSSLCLATNYQTSVVAGGGNGSTPMTGILTVWSSGGLLKSKALSVPTQSYNVVEDLVYDDVNQQVFLGGDATGTTRGALTITRFTLGSGGSITQNWQVPLTLAPGETSGGGCITLSPTTGNVVYLSNLTGTGAGSWYLDVSYSGSYISAGACAFKATSTLADSNGDLVILEQQSGLSTSYQLTKLSGSNLATTLFSSTITNTLGYDLVVTNVAQDAGGDYLVTDNEENGAHGIPIAVTGVDRCSESTGSYVATYQLSTNTVNWAFGIFPTSTSGEFYVTGTDNNSETLGTADFYPLTTEFNGYSIAWYYYSTATVP